jgi:NAD(P)-dependent dehydrogenase (short-subunit alcohol dehydrogenase family)
MNRCPHPHAVVTGASSGIGRATALQLARSGYHVFAGVRRPADGTALQQAAQQQAAQQQAAQQQAAQQQAAQQQVPAGELTPLPLDVTNPAQIKDAAASVTGHTAGAGLDTLVNNAGIGLFGPLEIIGIDDFRRQLEVNVTGQLEVTQAFLPLIRAAHGRIVMIGSIGARCTPPFVGALAASKSTLATMTEALRQELAPWGIRVVLVEPASVRTDAVGKLTRDTEQLLSQASPAGRALYADNFRRMVSAFTAQHEKGSPPEVVAETVVHALTAARPRAHYLTGKNSWRMALIARLPTPVQDAIRRRITDQPSPGAAAGRPGDHVPQASGGSAADGT